MVFEGKLTRKWWKRFHLRVKQVTHLAIGTEKYQYSWPNVKYLLRRTEIGYYLKFKKDKFGCERLYRGVYNGDKLLYEDETYGSNFDKKWYCVDVTGYQSVYRRSEDLYLIKMK